MHNREIAILLNELAGKGKAKYISNLLTLQLQSIQASFILFSEWPPELSGYSDIFLIGGDGTVNYFINRYPACNIPISLFPGGSGNDFAWKLNGRSGMDALLEIALNGNIISVDAGICNGRYFINGVGIGFDGRVVKSMGNKRFGSGSHLSYLITVLRHIVFYRETPMRIIIDQEERMENIFMISIANGSRYGGGFLVAPNALINDRVFDIVEISTLSVAARLINLPAMEKGNHLQRPFVKTSRANAVSITGDHVLAAHLDGELMESDKFEISVIPHQYLFRCNNQPGTPVAS